MINILVLGTTEKRHLILPMLYTLSNKGRTTLITDNKAFMMLSKDIEYDFFTEDTKICIVDYIEDVLPGTEDYEEIVAGSDYVVWDSVESTIPNPDAIIILDKGELYDTILDYNNIEMVPTFVYKTYDGLNKSVYHLLDFGESSKYSKQFNIISQSGKLIAFPGSINQIVSVILAETLSEKSSNILRVASKQRKDIKEIMKGGK